MCLCGIGHRVICVIVVDSNQLFQVQPNGPVWMLLKAVGKQTGHSLAISEVSLWEAVNKARELLEADEKAAVSAARKLSGRLAAYGDEAGPRAVPSGRVDAVVRKYESKLRDTFRVIKTAPEHGVEALRREALRLPPCKPSGEGGRDTAIWLSAAAAAAVEQEAANTELPLLFVSSDKGFADPADKLQLHPALLADLPGNLTAKLCRSISEVVAEISTPAGVDYLVLKPESQEVTEAIITTVVEWNFPDLPGALEARDGDGIHQIFTVGELLKGSRIRCEGFHEPPAITTSGSRSVVMGSCSWVFACPPWEGGDRFDSARSYAFNELVGRPLQVTATLAWTLDAESKLEHWEIVQWAADRPLQVPAVHMTVLDDIISAQRAEKQPAGDAWMFLTRQSDNSWPVP